MSDIRYCGILYCEATVLYSLLNELKPNNVISVMSNCSYFLGVLAVDYSPNQTDLKSVWGIRGGRKCSFLPCNTYYQTVIMWQCCLLLCLPDSNANGKAKVVWSASNYNDKKGQGKKSHFKVAMKVANEENFCQTSKFALLQKQIT